MISGFFAALDDDAEAIRPRLVDDVGDALDLPLVRRGPDALDERRLVDLEGQLVDHHLLLPWRPDSMWHFARTSRIARPRLVGVADGLAPADPPAGGKSARGVLHQLGRRDAGLVKHAVRVADLREIVGRDRRGHRDRDPGRAVDDQVGKKRPGRTNGSVRVSS